MKKRGREKTGNKEKLPGKLAKWLDIPESVLRAGCYLEMRGRNSVRLMGCRKILMYTPECITLGLGRGCVSFYGRRLVCTSYHAGSVEIDGVIDRVDFGVFPGEGGKGDGEEN